MSDDEVRDAEVKAWAANWGEIRGDRIRSAHMLAFRAGVEFARCKPGPATAKYLAWQRNEITLTYDEILEMKAAFMAEHEPARPENRPTSCPWKRSDMTPCVRTDGPVAYADDHCCVGCGRRPILTRVPLDESAWQEGVQP